MATSSLKHRAPSHIASVHSQHASHQSAVLPFVQRDALGVVEEARLGIDQDVEERAVSIRISVPS